MEIRDSDGHNIFYQGNKLPLLKEVYIGNYVWIGAHAAILKGASIKDGSVVGGIELV